MHEETFGSQLGTSRLVICHACEEGFMLAICLISWGYSLLPNFMLDGSDISCIHLLFL